MTEQEKIRAIENAIPRKPIKHELGGGYYYTCPWIMCNNTVHRFDRYCSQCGQRLRFDKDDDVIEIIREGEKNGRG